MSTETRAAVDQALAAHVADEMDGAMLTGWVTSISCVAPEYGDETGYFHDSAEGQAFHTSVGLRQVGLWRAQGSAMESQ